jgi:hypothetical protein
MCNFLAIYLVLWQAVGDLLNSLDDISFEMAGKSSGARCERSDFELWLALKRNG